MRVLICALWIASLFVVGCSSTNQHPALRLKFLDVGEGDSLLIQTPDNRAVLIDTGSPLAIPKLLKSLEREKISTIDSLILTHPDLDHIGGAFGIVGMLPIDNLHDNGQSLATHSEKNDIFRWFDSIRTGHNGYRSLRAGDYLNFKDLKLSVLWPPKGDLDQNWNKNSLVILITFAGRKILLMGDGEKEAELGLLSAGLLPSGIDILKAGHHASAATGLDDFIDYVKPSFIVVSTNKDNIRGYPSKETIRKYSRHGAILQTSVHGDIEFSIDLSGEIFHRWLN